MENVSTDKLRHDLRAVVLDAEELLKASADQTGERIERIRARAEDNLRQARARLQEAGATAQEQAREAARKINGQVHDNPWAAIGIAAGIGLLLGMLIHRR